MFTLIVILKSIAFISRKGGSGKTTCCVNIAAALAKTGQHKIAILDLDPQASAGVWIHARNTRHPDASPIAYASADKTSYPIEIGNFENDDFDFLLIDTPPVDKAWLEKLMGFSDLAVVPTKASPFDLAAVGATLGFLEGKNTAFKWMLNAVSLNAADLKPVATELKRSGPVCPGVVKEHSGMLFATGEGLGMCEYAPESRQAKAFELNAWDLVFHLRKNAGLRHLY